MARSGDLQVTKECSEYTGRAGDFCTITSTVTFSGGTGKFVGFEAHADVTADSDGLWHWDGTYSFD